MHGVTPAMRFTSLALMILSEVSPWSVFRGTGLSFISPIVDIIRKRGYNGGDQKNRKSLMVST